MATPVRIDVVSDVICPWCFIGKRRLEKALGQLNGEIDPRITWLPFQLNPEMPREGIPRAEYRERKFGSLERSRALDERGSAEARGEGLEFAFERMQRTPNTFAAHQLIDLAQGKSAGEAVVEGLFGAYFLEARDIGDRAVLLEVATGAGLKTADLEARWADAEHPRRVAATAEEMRNLGISGYQLSSSTGNTESPAPSRRRRSFRRSDKPRRRSQTRAKDHGLEQHKQRDNEHHQRRGGKPAQRRIRDFRLVRIIG